MSPPTVKAAPLFGRAEQFRLARLQTYNWGTFDGLVTVAVPDVGYLFVGPSGSGKSTLLDAHTALLTPPKWVDFNVAAREADRTGKDRNLMSYVRGAWAEQTGEHGEQSVQYLRSGTTWSALASTYRNGLGKTVVLAQVLWVRGSSTASTDVKKLYLVLQREFDVKELKVFAEGDFDVRRLKTTLPDAFVKQEFSGYQEHFRGLLGIENELALRLLHKTQSAKNLGDLNTFLRDFMLDTPETFETAERLVGEFGELSAAHQAVVAARQQIETLTPARAARDELVKSQREKCLCEELYAGVGPYKEERRAELLRLRIAELRVLAEGAQAELGRRKEVVAQSFDALSQLTLRRDGLTGPLASLERERDAKREELPRRQAKRAQLRSACSELGWETPEGTAEFAVTLGRARDRLDRDDELTRELSARKRTLEDEQRPLNEEFQALLAEIQAMERQRSNIPSQMLALRARIAAAIAVSEESLPFAGELIEVKKEEAAWQGAIERVLHNFALSLLVDDNQYQSISSFVDDQHLDQRLVYLRMVPRDEKRRSLTASSLARKLRLADSPCQEWLRSELAQRFDYECTDTMHAFRKAERAITRAGQVKSGHSRHEKDDRYAVDDRRRWVLGFDNRDKLKLFKDRAGEVGAELARLEQQLSTVADQEGRLRRDLRHCQTLVNLSWAEVDVDALAAAIAQLDEHITREQAARPELAALDAQIEIQRKRHQEADQARTEEEVRLRQYESERVKHERALEEREAGAVVRVTTAQQANLPVRFDSTKRKLSLETLESIASEVERRLAAEIRELGEHAVELRNQIENVFREFNRRWPAESDGLDARIQSADDYMTKLARLERDGLPRHEERFMQLLRDQSDQNLTLLSSRLDLERAAIRERLELVNESLLTAEFNPGTYLVIDPRDRAIEEVRQFKQDLREALNQSFSQDREQAERRFVALKALVDRLKSQETADRAWRNLVLDVRQHVEFLARELDDKGEELEVYRGGAGKSGGQRQKLAAFCLAAALRYQLGGQDRSLPSFATVALDEAFDKADAEFTTMAMNIFKTFGFQMLVATPLKSVMTLEPFIGGACYVSIRERKLSSMLTIDYDEDAKRLRLPEAVRGEEVAVS